MTTLEYPTTSQAASGGLQAVDAAHPMPTNSGPARHAAAITPADGADLPNAALAIWVGTTGAIKVDTVGGETAVTFTSVPVGFFPVQVKRVYATGTTATNLVAVY